jgi:hypothetical protein
MAQMLPDEGLDFWLGQYPGNDTRNTTSYLRLFTSQTASTVITHAQNAREHHRDDVHVLRGAVARDRDVGGRRRTADEPRPAAHLPAGHVPDRRRVRRDHQRVLHHPRHGPPTKVVGQANFDDVTAVPLLTNDVIKVTPTIALLH